MPFYGIAGGDVAAEASARAAADSAEASSRAAADSAEAARAAAAEAALAPRLTSVTPVTAVGPTAVAANTIVPTDTTSNAVGLTLPNAPADGTRVVVKQIIKGGTNVTTVNAAGADVFNKAGGSTAATLTLPSQSMSLQYAGSPKIWYVVADDEPLSGLDARYLPLTEAVNTVAAAGASQTLAATSTATVNDLTLTANCTITLPAGTPGSSFTLVLRQGGSGSYTVTFSPTPKYPNGAVPTLSTAVGAVDLFTFVYVTAWNCFAAGMALA